MIFGLHLRADTRAEGLAAFLHLMAPCFQVVLPTALCQPDFGFFSKTGLAPPLGLCSYLK